MSSLQGLLRGALRRSAESSAAKSGTFSPLIEGVRRVVDAWIGEPRVDERRRSATP